MRWLVALFLLTLTIVDVQAWLHGTTFVEPVGSVSIPVSSQAGPFPQSIGANNWTGFSSPAGSVFQNNNWTSPLLTFSYLQSTNYKVMAAQTTASARDVEVVTYVRDGTVFLRQFNGTAIFFTHNGDTASGELKFGIVTGLTGTTIIDGGGNPIGTYYTLYDNADLNGTVTGYNNASTNSALLKMGVSGLTIYAQFSNDNGATWVNINAQPIISNFDVTPGPVGLWANSLYGFRDVTVNYLPLAPLFSSPGLARWDPRDWGLKSGQTTGTITGGTTALTLAAPIGVVTGDSIIVAVGGESGLGARGTVGVGGNSPALSYANATAMNADTGQPDGTFAWTTDNGNAFVSTGGVWAQDGRYYLNKAMPKALLAKVTGVGGGGTSLTLDTNATATATTAAVYINNYGPLHDSMNPPSNLPALTYQTITIPSGTYAIGAPFATAAPAMTLPNNMVGWKVLGQGLASTILISPDGTTSAGLAMSQDTNTEVAGLKIIGNNRANGFGLQWSGNGATFFDFPRGINFTTNSDNSSAHDFETDDIFYCGYCVSFGTNVTASNCVVSQSFVPISGGSDIEPYHMEMSNSTGGGITNCTFTAPLLTGGLEAFQSNGFTYSGVTLNNGYLSLNGSGGSFQVNDLAINLAANSQSWYQATGPLIDINDNQPGNPGVSTGGTLNRPKIIQSGLYDGTNILQFVNIASTNPNITFAGTYTSSFNGAGCFSAQNWATGMNAFLGIGVRNDGTGTAVSGMRFIGQVNTGSGKTNIYAESGSLTSTNNIMDAFPIAVGGNVTSETGSETNATWNAANPGHLGC
jgi:hypothetical protein